MSNNQWAHNPQRRPPTGWKTSNWMFRTVLTQAKRAGYQPLIHRVEQMNTASRHELALVLDPIARAAKGDIDPATIDIDAILEEDKNKDV